MKPTRVASNFIPHVLGNWRMPCPTCGMIGQSPAICEICKTILQVAPLDVTVLLRGDTGTGKELAAQAIHRNSPRANRPFVPINCAALTESLLESELFGHERGAFTGAIGLKKGKFEIA